MPLYLNETHRDRESVQLGPYTFKKGFILVSQAADATVGPILTNHYGCKKLTEAQEKQYIAALKKKQNAESAESLNDSTDKTSDAAEKAEAAAKEASKAEENQSSKPEDKM